MLIVLCALSCGLAQAVEPLAYWPMDTIKDGVVADASGHGHDAFAHGLDGKLPKVVPGMAGNGLKFTAASEQYLEVKQSAGLLAPAAFTVMAWIKPVARGGTYEIIGNYIGRKNAYAFEGLMDEVKVFAAVLSAEEIYTEAARGMTP